MSTQLDIITDAPAMVSQEKQPKSSNKIQSKFQMAMNQNYGLQFHMAD